MEKNIAVAGCGYWGRNLVRNFAELGALHTICDTSREALGRFDGLYPDARRETSFDAVLADGEIRGVVISSPAALHYSMAKSALEAGKAVFVEKPLSLKVEEGEELVKLAEAGHRVLMVGHVLEYHPGIIRLKQLVDEGKLGKINYIYSNRLNLGKFRTEENILWSFAPHDISVILLLLGELPQQVSAHGGYYLHKDIADVTVSTLSFASGVRAHVFVNWLHPYKEQKLVVVGDIGMAVFDDVAAENKLLLYGHGVDWVNGVPVPLKQDPTPVEFATAEPLRLECQHFVECVETHHRPKTDGASGLRVLRVLDACQRSLEGSGGAVSLAARNSPYIHPTSIVEEPCEIGDGTRVWHFTHVMPHARIGRDCILGQNVFIGENVSIGDNVKIQNNVSVYEGVTLEDYVFCGPSCVFTNVRVPRGHIVQKGKYTPTLVKKGATIGANATIVCGTTIGKYAFVGAGAVVTKDIPDYARAHGSPARVLGWICECGGNLDFGDGAEASCSGCGKAYRKRRQDSGAVVEGVSS